MATQNKKTMPEGMAKRFDPEGETTGDRSNRREKVAGMSGGLLVVCLVTFWREHIGAQKFEEHEAGARNAGGSPLRNSTYGDFAKPGNFEASAEFVNDFVLVHVQYLRQLRVLVQAI
jgi:hypothetical protein